MRQSRPPGILEQRRPDYDELRLGEIEGQIAAIRKNPFRGNDDGVLKVLMSERDRVLVRLGQLAPEVAYQRQVGPVPKPIQPTTTMPKLGEPL